MQTIAGRRRAEVMAAWAVLLALALVAALAAPASAHIKNEASQFPDIEAHPAAGDIVMLVGLGVVPETPVFEPEGALTLEDLAAWAALARGLGQGGENPDVEQLAELAADEGLVPSLEGEATYDDLNQAVFDGAVEVGDDRQGAVPNRAEAAAFTAEHLMADLGEETTLLDRLGARMGPTGEVEQVDAGEDATVFTTGGEQLPVDAHGRVAFGPTDLIQWEGRYVTRSLVAGEGEQERLVFVEAGQPPEEDPEENGDEPELPGTGADDPGDEPQEDAPQDETAAAGPNWLLYGLLALLVVLAVVIFGRR